MYLITNQLNTIQDHCTRQTKSHGIFVLINMYTRFVKFIQNKKNQHKTFLNLFKTLSQIQL